MSLALVSNNKNKSGFTIIEVIVVVAIIGILATISFVVYSGITKKAAYAAMQAEASDLSNQLAMYSADNGDYPATEDWYYDYEDECYGIVGDEDFCFESDYSIDYGYEDETDDYWIEIWPTDDEYIGVPPDDIPDDEEGDDTVSVIPKPCKTNTCGGGVIVPPGGGIQDGLPKEETCPTGFIPVPGSARYAQPGFCVMKYEAKIVAGKAVSQPEGVPATNINYEDAESLASQACEGCHVMTNREWMTLARNVISQPDNWVSGRVGNGIMYKGSSFSSSYGASATNNDSDGYFGLFPGYNDYEKRTLLLSNGQTIWDLAGNVEEYVKVSNSGSGVYFTLKPELSPYPYSVYLWDSLNTGSTSITPSPFPVNMSIGSIDNSSSYEQGLGLFDGILSSSFPENGAFVRGGSYFNGFSGGLLSLRITNLDSRQRITTGFRVAK